MKSIEKQVELAINDDYKYKADVLADVKNLIEENETLKSKIVPSSDGMSEETLNLFMENYENKGFCKGLETKLKTIEKEFKKSGITKVIKYLPWAIAERIFRMQGGKIEVVDWKYAVEFSAQEYNAETGEVEQGTRNALFVHLRATWKGETLDEYYPIFDNQTSKVVKTPDSQQLNTSRQRGSVRLIARLTGIGLWIFEQQDDQFGEDDSEEVIKPISKDDTPKEPIIAKDKSSKKEEAKSKEEAKLAKEEAKKAKDEAKKSKDEEKDDAMKEALGGVVEEGIQEPEPNAMDMFKGNIVKNNEPKDEPKKETPPTPSGEKEDYKKDSEQYADLLIKVKSHVKTQKDLILAFRNEKGKELLGDLTYGELKELLGKLEK